jgi:hypothetical protein
VMTRRPPGGSIAEQFFISIPGASKCSITSPGDDYIEVRSPFNIWLRNVAQAESKGDCPKSEC